MIRKWTAIGVCAGFLTVGCAEAPSDEPEGVITATGSEPTTTFGDPGASTGEQGTTGGAEESDDDDDEDEGGSFIDMTTGDDGEPDVACDVWTQDCPEGEKCTAYIKNGGVSWDATKCVAVTDNPTTPGAPCTATSGGSGDDDCDFGSMCWGVDEEGVGYCVSLCTGNEQNNVCEDPDTSCVIVNEGILNLCLPDCHPLLQDCPIDTEGCYPAPSGFACAPDVSGGVGAGEPCGGINTCTAGTFCTGAEFLEECAGASCCTEFCGTDEEDMCGGALACVALAEPGQAEPGQDNVGGCVLPG